MSSRTKVEPSTATIVAFCPDCQGNEIEVTPTPIITGGVENKAKCLLCKWEGTIRDLLCAVGPSTEHMWNGERVANVLLYAASKYAAGPMLQVLELLGLLPQIKGSKEERASAENVRSEVLKAVLEAVTTAAFEKTAEMSTDHFVRFDRKQAEATARIFSYATGAAHGQA